MEILKSVRGLAAVELTELSFNLSSRGHADYQWPSSSFIGYEFSTNYLDAMSSEDSARPHGYVLHSNQSVEHIDPTLSLSFGTSVTSPPNEQVIFSLARPQLGASLCTPSVSLSLVSAHPSLAAYVDLQPTDSAPRPSDVTYRDFILSLDVREDIDEQWKTLATQLYMCLLQLEFESGRGLEAEVLKAGLDDIIEKFCMNVSRASRTSLEGSLTVERQGGLTAEEEANLKALGNSTRHLFAKAMVVEYS